jgi:hypothetical protein
LDKVLINLDIGAPGALLRVVLGLLLVPALDAVHADAGLWLTSAWLLAALFGIKVVAAAARKALPASALVRSHWEWRRNLARYYDSYQWRKLLWLGVGIMIGGAMGWPGTETQWLLGVVCFASGAVAEILWRRLGLRLAPQAA